MIQEQKQLHADLNVFLIIIISLLIIGFLFIYSSSSVFALEKYGSTHYFVKKHLFGLLIGSIGLLAFRLVPLSFIQKISPLLFFGSLGLTALTLFPSMGVHIHGSSRWLCIAGFSFQPSELLKISLLIYLAHLLSKKEGRLSLLKGYAPFLITLAITSIVLLKQPDFGTTITLLATAFTLFFIINFQLKHLFLMVSVMISLSLALIYYRPYRWRRILIFLNPWADPQGAGFQIIQSLIAIGSGGFLGIGVSHSKQKFFYLPMQHTDFIFSIIAEETGFLGSSLLVLLYILFLYFGMRIAWKLRHSFASFVTLGFVILITLQSTINFGVTTGLVPTKGIGLPFVSYGNSALVTSLCMVGLIMNCIAQNSRRQYG